MTKSHRRRLTKKYIKEQTDAALKNYRTQKELLLLIVLPLQVVGMSLSTAFYKDASDQSLENNLAIVPRQILAPKIRMYPERGIWANWI